MIKASLFLLILNFWGSLCFGNAILLRQLLNENRLEEAVPICRQYEVLPSRDDEVYFACAWIYFRSFRASAADAVMAKLKNSKTLPEYHLLLIYSSVASLLQSPEAVKTMEANEKQLYTEKLKNRITETQKLLESFISSKKNTPAAKMAQELNAELYEMKGQLEPAAFLYRGLIADNPKSGRAHWGLGRYYLARGDFRKAKNHFEQTAQFWPKHMGSRYNLALIYISEGPENYSEAAKWLTEAFKLDSADVGVLEQIGVILEGSNKMTPIWKYWKRALELNPKAAIATKKLQQYSYVVVEDLIQQQKYEEALTKMGPEKSSEELEIDELSVYRGICYRNLGDFKKAKRYLTGFVTEVGPKNPLAIRELGIVEFNLERYDEALAYFEKASVLEKSEALNFAWMGFSFEAKKDFPKALEAWAKAASLFKDPAEVKKSLDKVAKLEIKLGKREVAQEEKAPESEPEGKTESKKEPKVEPKNEAPTDPEEW